MARPMNEPCPCGSDTIYKRCCYRYHRGAMVKTPDLVVRARYCAYAVGHLDYLMRTTHPDSPHFRKNKQRWEAELRSFTEFTKFVHLGIMNVTESDDGQTAWVTFQAGMVQKGQPTPFLERSEFRKVKGKWLYLKGDTPR